MQTEHRDWQEWLDGRVDVELSNTPLWALGKVPGLGFGKKRPLLLLGRDAKAGVVTVSDKMTRRELLWEIHKQLGVIIDFVGYQGRTVIRIRSQAYMEITDPSRR